MARIRSQPIREKSHTGSGHTCLRPPLTRSRNSTPRSSRLSSGDTGHGSNSGSVASSSGAVPRVEKLDRHQSHGCAIHRFDGAPSRASASLQGGRLGRAHPARDESVRRDSTSRCRRNHKGVLAARVRRWGSHLRTDRASGAGTQACRRRRPDSVGETATNERVRQPTIGQALASAPPESPGIGLIGRIVDGGTRPADRGTQMTVIREVMTQQLVTLSP